MTKNPDSAVLTEAARVHKRYQKALDRAEGLRPERDAAVIRALDAGCSMRQVAAATGIHLARVGQISQKRQPKLDSESPGDGQVPGRDRSPEEP